jgi:hypothetical protein
MAIPFKVWLLWHPDIWLYRHVQIGVRVGCMYILLVFYFMWRIAVTFVRVEDHLTFLFPYTEFIQIILKGGTRSTIIFWWNIILCINICLKTIIFYNHIWQILKNLCNKCQNRKGCGTRLLFIILDKKIYITMWTFFQSKQWSCCCPMLTLVYLCIKTRGSKTTSCDKVCQWLVAGR